MRRIDRETGIGEAIEIICSAPYAVLSAVDAEGRPYSTPVSPVLVDGVLYFHSAAEDGARARAIVMHPDVSLCFVARCEILANRYTIDYASAIVRGICRRVDDADECRKALDAIAVHYDPNCDPRATKDYIDGARQKVCVWRVDIAELSGKSRHPRHAS